MTITCNCFVGLLGSQYLLQNPEESSRLKFFLRIEASCLHSLVGQHKLSASRGAHETDCLELGVMLEPCIGGD
jgi:hypothetical protein